MEVLRMLCLFLAIFLTHTRANDINDAWCTVPSVAEGDSTTLTCYFKDNLNKTKESVYVQHAQHGQYTEILTCLWLNPDRPECDTKPGYEFDRRINNTLNLTIPSATKLHVGGYMCQVTLSDETIPCYFNLADTGLSEVINQTSTAFQITYQARRTTLAAGIHNDQGEAGHTEVPYFTSRQTTDSTDNSDDGKGNHVIVIAIVIPVILVVICLVVIFICRKRLTIHWRNCITGGRHRTNECSEENDQTQSQPLVTIKDSMSPTTTQPSAQPVDRRRIPASHDETTKAKSPEVTEKTKEKPFSVYLCNRAVQLLEKTRAVVITGPKKCGKTSALGTHVFNYFTEKGLVPLALGELSQWQEKKQDNKDHVVLLDEFKIEKHSAKTLISMLLDEHCYIIFIVQSDAMNRECREGGISISLKTLPVVEFVKQVSSDTKRLNQLFDACYKNNVEQVVTLLSGGVDPNRSDGEDKTPLHIACEYGHVQIVSNLLWAGCRINHQDKQMRTPLHIACEHGHASIVAKLFSAGCDVNFQDIHECTPLHIACEHGHLNIVNMLLLADCDVNARDKTNSTPLHYACKCPKQSRGDEAANDDEDPSPSQESYESPRETVVKRLLASGARLDAVDNKNRTPLHLACESNNYASVKILLQGGADVKAKDDEGQTPLHVACQHNNRPIVKSLIYAKSDVNAKDNEGFTPLHLACLMKANDSVEVLLNANAVVEERAEGGLTPLHCACHAGSKEIIQMLLNKGADIHVTDMHGRTPEIVATSKGHLDIIYLISTAADETPSPRSVGVDVQFPLDYEYFS